MFWLRRVIFFDTLIKTTDRINLHLLVKIQTCRRSVPVETPLSVYVFIWIETLFESKTQTLCLKYFFEQFQSVIVGRKYT